MSKTIDSGLCGTQHIYTNDKIKRLLNSNRESLLNGDKSNAICYDGVVDEKNFCEIRLAFLLKETNGNTSKGEQPEKYEDWNYVEWIGKLASREEPLYPAFRNIAMWTSTFSDIVENGTSSEDKYLNNNALIVTNELCGNLNKIAVVNLKKTFGGGSTDWNTLDKYLSNQTIKDVLKEEIEMINPTVVLCGGRQVFDLACNIFEGQEEKIETKGGNIVSYFKHNKAIYVSFYHPSCRKSRKSMFYYGADVFETIIPMVY